MENENYEPQILLPSEDVPYPYRLKLMGKLDSKVILGFEKAYLGRYENIAPEEIVKRKPPVLVFDPRRRDMELDIGPQRSKVGDILFGTIGPDDCHLMYFDNLANAFSYFEENFPVKEK